MKAALAAAAMAILVCAGDATAASLAPADLEKLTRYQVIGVDTVSLAIASRPGRNAETARTVLRQGGVVRFRRDSIAYLTAVVPRAVVALLAASDSVQAIAVDEIGFAPEYNAAESWPRSQPVLQPPVAPPEDTRWDQFWDDRRLRPPYPFLKDLSADDWQREHPTWDGRGVLIALVEGFPDFLLPELQTALDSHGSEIPKFRDTLNLPDLSASLKDARPVGTTAWQWVRLDPPVRAQAGAIQQASGILRTPAKDGEYRLGVLRFPATQARSLKLGSADSAENGDALDFDVLWSPSKLEARVDANRDGDFTNDAPVREYRAARHFGVMGEDDPRTPLRESVGYALQRSGEYLSFNFGLDSHVTLTNSTAAARAGERGLIDGVAPGAQLLPVYSGQQASTFAQALIVAFESPADVVCLEAYTAIVYPYVAAGGRSVMDFVTQRLIEKTGKPFLYTAGNRLGFGMSLNPIAPDALNVGAAQSRGATYAQLGVRVAPDFILHSVGSDGPADTGAAKPDFLAPVLAIGLRPGFERPGVRESPIPLPPGYLVGGGTSTAAPVAAGAVALLVSAARQAGISYDARSIAHALKASALALPGVGAHQQGAGVIRVDVAWRNLVLQSSKSAPPVFTTRAPVHTRTSRNLVPADEGEGLLVREGWAAGTSGTRVIKVRRQGGLLTNVAYDLIWSTDEATFKAPARVVLPPGEFVSIPVEIHPATPGAHSAFLLLRDVATGEIAHRILCTVVAADALSAANRYQLMQTVEVPQNGRRSVFFDVPARQDVLTVTLRRGTGAIFAFVHSPTGDTMTPNFLPSAETGQVSVSFPAPMRGVWQIVLGDLSNLMQYVPESALQGLPPTAVEVSVSTAAVNIQAGDDPRQLTIGNRGGDIRGVLSSTYLGGVRRLVGRLEGNEARLVELLVPPDTRSLFAEATGDVDLSLYDCTSGTCQPGAYRRSQPGEGRRFLFAEHPKPGLWYVTVSARNSGESTSFEYADIITHPRAGSWVTDDIENERASGATWGVSARYTIGTPGVDRTPAVLLYLKDSSRQQLEFFKPGGTFPYLNAEWSGVPLGSHIVDLDR
ncbi:MAG TPA: S8 family serine peptidase [Steroidobacteraceae bacterium]|nr:S8 family serine peptidase [Steroidobacteraceae bacterium]